MNGLDLKNWLLQFSDEELKERLVEFYNGECFFPNTVRFDTSVPGDKKLNTITFSDERV